MSDTADTNSRTPTPELKDSEEISEDPVPAPFPLSLPDRFTNPQIPKSERPVVEISGDNLFIHQSIDVIESNETLLKNVNQTLAAVDSVLVHTNLTLHTNILDQTIMMNDEWIHSTTKQFRNRKFPTDRKSSDKYPNTEQPTRTSIVIREIRRHHRTRSSLEVITGDIQWGKSRRPRAVLRTM